MGDFALFVFYLEFLSELTAFSGLLVARYHQIGISVERMQRLMEGAPADALVEFSPVYLDGKFPPVVYPHERRSQPAAAPGSAQPELSLPRHRERHPAA